MVKYWCKKVESRGGKRASPSHLVPTHKACKKWDREEWILKGAGKTLACPHKKVRAMQGGPADITHFKSNI